MIVPYHHPEISMTLAESSSVSISEKNMVLRAHVNLGHPSVKEFARLLKAAGTRNDIITYVLREFHCEAWRSANNHCLPSATPRTYDFNVVVGVDLLFVHGHDDRDEHPILNVTCMGTLYSTFTMVDAHRKGAALVWSSFLKCRLRTFGSPRIMDQGLGFQGNFIDGLESHGIQPSLIDREAPFQNGVTERRGGLFKEVHYKTRGLHQPAGLQEVQDMVHEVSWALQTMTNRCGYLPAQRVLGKQPSLAMEILNDSGEYTFSNTNDEAWKRCEQIRQAARKALVEVDGRERLQRTVRARPRRALETLQFEESEFLSMCGDRSREEVKQKLDLASSSCRRATQFGSPGEVNCGSATKAKSSRWATWKNNGLKSSLWSSSVPRRSSVFIQKNLAMLTWRARGARTWARTSFSARPSTTSTAQRQQSNLDDIHRRVLQTPRGTPEGLRTPNPKTPRTLQASPTTPVTQPHQSPQPTTPAIHRTMPMTPLPATAIPVPESPPQSRPPSPAPAINQQEQATATTTETFTPDKRHTPYRTDKTNRSRSPPGREQEPTSTASSSTAKPATTHRAVHRKPATQSQQTPPTTEADELWRATVENERARSSTTHLPQEQPDEPPPLRCWRRYDLSAKRYLASNPKGPLWGVVRRITIDLDASRQDHHWRPHGAQPSWKTSNWGGQHWDHPCVPADSWTSRPRRSIWWSSTTCATSTTRSTSSRRCTTGGCWHEAWTWRSNTKWTSHQQVQDLWHVASWRFDRVGWLQISMTCSTSRNSTRATSTTRWTKSCKMMSQPIWPSKVARSWMRRNWLKQSWSFFKKPSCWRSTTWSIPMPLRMSLVRKSWPRPSRTNHTGSCHPDSSSRKAGEVGESWKAKARWILLGHKDPDAMSLERYAPTPSSTTVMMCLQITATMKFHLYIMDVSSPFGQSYPHGREQTPLFASMPPTGIPNVPQHALVRVLTAVYGLANGPAIWRKTLRRHLIEVGYLESVFDPCLYYLKPNESKMAEFGKFGVAGIVLLDVDDFC